MSIQASVNQALWNIGYGMRLSGLADKLALKAQYNQLNPKVANLRENLQQGEGDAPASDFDKEQAAKLLKENADLTEKMYNEDPNKNNFENYKGAKEAYDKLMSRLKEEKEFTESKKAEKRTARKQGFTMFKEDLMEKGLSEKYIMDNKDALKKVYSENKDIYKGARK